MLTTTQAIVLQKTKYGDSRLLISMFTREYGTMSFSYNTPSNPRHSVANLFQSLTPLDIEFDLKPKATIHRLLQVKLSSPMRGIHSDPEKMAMVMFLADVMRFALSHEQQNLPLYEFIADSISWLNSRKGDKSNFHIIFTLHLLKYLGVAPPMVHEGFFVYDNMHEMRLSRQQRHDILDTIVEYYETQLPSFPHIKSLAVIKELL